MTSVASFANSTTLTGYGVRSTGGLGGGSFFIITNGASGASNWTTLYHRILYPGGNITTGNFTVYSNTQTFNRSDFTYDGSVFAGQEQWSLTVGGFSGVTGPSMGSYPFVVEVA